MQTWVYHATEVPKVVTYEQAEELYEDGWADSPAQFLKLEDCGVDQEKTDAGDPEETLLAQQALQACNGVADQLNGMLNLDDMSKDELIAFAKEHFSEEVDKRRSKKNLVNEIRGLNGDS